MRNDFFSKLFESYSTVPYMQPGQSQAGGCKITTPCSQMRTEKRESYFRKSLQLRVQLQVLRLCLHEAFQPGLSSTRVRFQPAMCTK